MKKSDRIENMLTGMEAGPRGDGAAYDRCYAGWFTCFNAGRYYEAHDVLEQLWLRTSGADRAFFKGLIQIAGAFVHLRKHFERPWHPKDATRLRPASRLFGLGCANLAPFQPVHLRLDIASVRALCEEITTAIKVSGFSRNPWDPARAPRIELAG
jgi:hypothetical protein